MKRTKGEILREIEFENARLSRLCEELKEIMEEEDADEYISVAEASCLCGMTERQLKYRATLGEVKEKRLSPRKRLLCKGDVIRLAQSYGL